MTGWMQRDANAIVQHRFAIGECLQLDVAQAVAQNAGAFFSAQDSWRGQRGHGQNGRG